MPRSRWVARLFPSRPAARPSRPVTRLRLVSLEDRAVPASTILIQSGMGGQTTIPAAATSFTDNTPVVLDPSAFAGQTGPVNLQANTSITFNSPVTLSSPLTAQAASAGGTGGTISVNAAIAAGANDLTLVTDNLALNGDGNFGSVAGTGTLAIRPFTPTRPIVLGGTMSVGVGTLNLPQDLTFASTAGLNSTGFGNILIGGAYDGTTPGAGTQTYAGAVTMAGGVAAQSNVSVVTSAAGSVTLTQPITDVGGDLVLVTGTASDSSTVSVTSGKGAGGNLTIDADNLFLTGTQLGTVSGSGTLSIRPLTQGRPIVLGGPVGTPAGTSLVLNQDATTFTPGGLNQTAFGDIVIGGVYDAAVPALAGQAYSGAISTAGATAAQSNVTLQTAGPITISNNFTDVPAGAAPAGNLTLVNGGPLTLGSAAGTTAMVAGNIAQLGFGPVVVTGTAALASNNAGIAFFGPIDGSAVGTGNLTLTATKGTIALPQSVGATAPLASLVVNGSAITPGGATYSTTGNQTYTGPVTPSAANLVLSAGTTTDTTATLTINTSLAAVGSLALDANQLALNGTFGSVSGPGTLTLQPVNPAEPIVLGGTTTTAGSLSLTQDPTFASGTGLNSTAFSMILIGGPAYTGPITTGGDTAAQSNVTIQTAGGITIANNFLDTPQNGNPSPGNLTLSNGGTLTLGSAAGTTATVNGTIAQTGAGPVVVSGTSTLTSNNAGISFAGPVGGSAAGVGNLTLTATKGTVASTGTTAGTGGTTNPLANLTVMAQSAGTTAAPFTFAANTLSVTTTAAGGDNLQAVGTTTVQTLNAGTGPVILTGGTFQLAAAETTTSPVVVGGTATLGGSGTVGAVTVNSGGTVAPGTSSTGGPLNTGNVTLAAGSTFAGYIGGVTFPPPSTLATIGASRLNSTGAVNLGGATLTLAGRGSGVTGNTFTLVQSTVPIRGTFANQSEGSTVTAGSTSYRISYLNDAVTLTAVAVTNTTITVTPNPATAGQPVTVSVTVSGGTPGVPVTFTVAPAGSSQTTTVGSVPLPANRQITFTIPGSDTTFAPGGTYTVTATYAGDATTAGSTGTTTVTVNPAAVSPPPPMSPPPMSPPPMSPPPMSPPPMSPPPPVPTPSRVGQSDVAQFAVAAGTTGTVTVYNGDGSVAYTVNPFGPGVAVRAIVADVNGDGTPDVIAGTGPGQTARVVVLDGVTRQVVRTFTPYESTFTGGVFLAAGDIEGTGKADVVISPDVGGSARVEVYSGATGQLVANFFGIDDTNFRGGARVAVADVNGDGKADVIVAAGQGGGPRVAVYDGKSLAAGTTAGAAPTPTRLTPDFYAFESTLRDGAYVSAGDFNGDGKADLAFGGGPSGGPRVLVVNGATLLSSGSQTLSPVANFFVGDSTLRTGAQLAVKHLGADNTADLVTAVPSATGTRVELFLGSKLSATGTPPAYRDLGTTDDTLGVFVG